jgi:hypothetical protein
LEIFDLPENRLPFARIIKPSLPLRIESIPCHLGKTPQGNAIRRIEYFLAALRCHGKYGPSLRKIMRPGKTAPQSCGAKATELSPCVPPFSKIHLAKSRNNQTQLQEPIQID